MDKKYFKTIYVLFKKELMSYFNSPIAYIFIGVFLIVGNWLFFKNFYLIGQASMRAYFDLLPWIFLFMSPAISMRIWAEEKKSGTIEFLLTLPITDWQVVLAKFFSALACFVAFIIGADFVLLGAPQFLVPVMKFAGLGSHFYNIAKGVIDSKDVIYYCSFIFVFLWLNTRVIESRGWK